MKNKFTLLRLISVLMFIFSIGTVSAQWTPIGPEGGFINCLKGTGSTMYAVSNKVGLYRSTDNGNHWTYVSSTTLPSDIRAIEKIGNMLFLGTGSGVYRSDDDGNTWVLKTNGFPGASSGHWVNKLAVCDTTLFAAATSSKILRSTDYGETWEVKANGITCNAINAVIATATSIFTGGGSNKMGVFRSTDNGETWQKVTTGMYYYQGGVPYYNYAPNINALRFNGTDLYAGTLNSQGIWKSSDNGDNWVLTNVSTRDNITYNDLIGNGSFIYAATSINGIFLSTDNGANWSTSNSGIDIYHNALSLLESGGNIFCGTKAGLYKTTDNGQNWTSSEEGIIGHGLVNTGLVSTGTDIFAGTNSGGVFRSTDAGNSWLKVNNGLPLNQNVSYYPQLYSSSTTLFGYGLMSSDHGDNWVPFNSPGGNSWENDMAWIEHGTAKFAVKSYENPGVYRSTDNGVTWDLVNNGIGVNDYVFVAIFSDGNTLYLGTDVAYYYSDGNGENWKAGSFPNYNSWAFGSRASFISTGTCNLMGLAGGGAMRGIYRTTDQGANWFKMSDFIVYKIVVSGSKIWASGLNLEEVNGTMTEVPAIFLSQDDGQNWIKVNGSLSINNRALAAEGPNIYTATYSPVYDVLRSSDNGTNWVSIGTGLHPNAQVVALDIFNGKIFASTTGYSLWQRNLDEFTIPAQPDAIAGSTEPCIGSSLTYSVTNVPGVTYTWQFPAGWSIVSGENTNSVTVTVGAQGGVIIVTPSNEFGTGSAQAMVVTPTSEAPAQPGAITGPDAPEMNTEVVYSVEREYGVIYNWSFPEGWVQQSGGNRHSVTVLVGEASGEVTVTATTPCGTSEPTVLSVTPFNPNMPLVFMVTGGGSYCEGDAGLPVGLSGSQEETLYTLYKDGVIQSTLTGDGNVLTFGNQLEGTYTVMADNGLNTIWMSGSAVLAESSSIPVSVVISTNQQEICEGSSATITAIGENGGTNPAYAWYLNGEATGGNSPEYTFAPVDSDQVYVVLTSDLGECVVNNPATSNTISIQTTENLPVSVSIVPDANDVCAGTPVTFTASPVNGGSPNYQWYVNGEQTGTDQASFSYIPEDEDEVYAVMTSSLTCTSNNPATSNVVTMVINALPEVEVQISADNNNVCAGTLVTFTATPVNGGENPEYVWQVNGVQQGIDEPTFTYTPDNGDQVNVVMTSDLPCTQENPATSNTIFMAVNDILPVSVVITADDDAVCVGTPVTLTATPQNGGTATYQWYVNASPAGANQASLTYTPENGDMVYVELTSSLSCVSGNPATSNIVEITVDQEVTPSVTISASTNPVLSGEPVTFTATPVNGGTDPEYLWFLNGFTVGAGASYTYIPVDGDEVYVVMTSSLECLTNMSAVSNTIVVEVITGTLVMKSDSVRVTSYDNNVVITRKGGLKGHVEVIDLTGRLIQERTMTGEDRMEIAIGSGSGIYLVRVNSSEGPVNEKVFIR